MKFSIGNKKLGPNVLHLSRPVGLTCPLTCAYHPKSEGPGKNKCYMIRMEGIHPNVRKAASENLEIDLQVLVEALSSHHGKLVRLHVGGDFLKPDGTLDILYILRWRRAMDRVPHSRILCFTHVYSKVLLLAFKRYAPEFQLIASINNELDLARARRAGFTRFALAMEEKHYEWDKGQAWVERFGLRFLVCPEIRKKLPNCESCGYCWRAWEHGGHVAFLEHSQPDWPAIWDRKHKAALQKG